MQPLHRSVLSFVALVTACGGARTEVPATAAGGESAPPVSTTTVSPATTLLAPGFGELRLSGEAGGDRQANDLGVGCFGYVAEAPQHRLAIEDGHGPITFRSFGRAGNDTTLVIRDSNGAFHCNDDAFGLDPMVTIAEPPVGLMDVFVGAYDPFHESSQTYQLVVREGAAPIE